MESIRNIGLKIKSFAASPSGSDTAVVLIMILVGVGSFGLGRLSVREAEPPEPVRIIEPITEAGSGEVVASKNGTKYHFPWCAGANQISEVNKVSFTSASLARAAGYLPAANCKGLE